MNVRKGKNRAETRVAKSVGVKLESIGLHI